MEEFITGGAPQKHSIWDEYVPIITTGRTTDIYLTEPIDSPSEYNQTCHVLNSAFEGDKVSMHINNGGGYVDSGFMMSNSMKNTKAKILGKLSGTVASISTVLTMCCDNIEVADYTSFMIHNYSGGAQGKGHEMKAQMEFTDAELNKAFSEIYGGFLTEEEMSSVIAGGDIWMGKDELLARWDAKKTDNTDKLEEIAESRRAKLDDLKGIVEFLKTLSPEEARFVITESGLLDRKLEEHVEPKTTEPVVTK